MSLVQSWLADPDIAIVLTGMLVGTAAALLGPFLVLRQNAMLSDAISHSILFGIVMVWLLAGVASGPLQIFGAALTGVLTVWLTELLAGTGRMRDDAAIGLVFAALFSAGVLLLNLFARNAHLDMHSVLLGEIGFVWLDTVAWAGLDWPKALLWMGAVTVANAVFVGLFWKELKLATFDPVLARAFGMRPGLLSYGLLFLLSATAVAAFDAVGVVLFVAFVIVPPSAAYLLTDRLGPMVLIGIAIAWVSALVGHPVAVALDVSIGATMALMTGACLGAALVLGPRGIVARLAERRRSALVNEERALLVHLMTHEGSGEDHRENVASALSTHLGWDTPQADAVLRRSLAEGYVLRHGDRLHLTEKGRGLAAALIEPWRR